MGDTGERILSCLSSALKPEANNARVADTLATEIDTARSTATAIAATRDVTLTRNRTLDHVARLFNVARRPGESDAGLRSRITTQIKRYYSCGTLADVRDVIEYFTGLSGNQIRIMEPPEAYEGWGYGEGGYGTLPWGSTPRATFRVELLADPDPLSIPVLMQALEFVRAAGVYVQALGITTSLQEIHASAEGLALWDVSSPLRSGYGAAGYGEGGYGYCAYAVRATAEGAVDLVIEPSCTVVAMAASYLGYGGWRYGQYEYGR